MGAQGVPEVNEATLIAASFALAGCLVALGFFLRGRRGAAPSGCAGLATKRDLEQTEERINMKLSELNAALDAVNTQLEKVKTEVQTLKDSLSDVDLPADAQASLDRLTSLAKAIDDINPDA